jgi:hypothetical protein
MPASKKGGARRGRIETLDEGSATQDTWGLAMIKEAKDCEDFIARRNRLGVRIIRELVESGYTTSPFGGVHATQETIEENRKRVANLVDLLRNMRAFLRGDDSDILLEERVLVHAVRDAAIDTRHHLAGDAQMRSWELGKEKRFDTNTLEGAVDAVFTIAEREMHPDRFTLLTAQKTREQVRLAVGYRGKFIPPSKARSSAAPRWLEPLFEAALTAGILASDALHAGGWYQSLLKRGILGKERGKKI